MRAHFKSVLLGQRSYPAHGSHITRMSAASNIARTDVRKNLRFVPYTFAYITIDIYGKLIHLKQTYHF